MAHKTSSRSGSWSRLRKISVEKIFPLIKSPTTPKSAEEPFRISHTPDRLAKPVSAAAAPPEDECKRFLQSFKGVSDNAEEEDDDDNDDDDLSEQESTTKSPHAIEQNTTTGTRTRSRSKSYETLYSSSWQAWPPAEPDEGLPQFVDCKKAPPLRITTQDFNRLSMETEVLTPEVEEAQLVRTTSSAGAKVVNLPGSQKTGKPQRKHQRTKTIDETISPRSEVKAREEDPFAEDSKPTSAFGGSTVRTLEDARFRSTLLASHRRASQSSSEPRDSGYEAGRQSSISASSTSTDRRDSSQYSSQYSSSPSSFGFSSWSSLGGAGSGEGGSPTSSRSTDSSSFGHIAHQLSPISEHVESFNRTGRFPQHGRFKSLPAIPRIGGPKRAKPPSLHRQNKSNGETPFSRFQIWQMEERERHERDAEVYGGWSEYYFEASCASRGDWPSARKMNHWAQEQRNEEREEEEDDDDDDETAAIIEAYSDTDFVPRSMGRSFTSPAASCFPERTSSRGWSLSPDKPWEEPEVLLRQKSGRKVAPPGFYFEHEGPGEGWAKQHTTTRGYHWERSSNFDAWRPEVCDDATPGMILDKFVPFDASIRQAI